MNTHCPVCSFQKKNHHNKITDIHLEDETLTLWRPLVDPFQYHLIPEVITDEEWPAMLQLYYTKFDCISSVLPFDEALPIIAQQTTTLVPTHDYSILRDYPRIRGLWYQPERLEFLGLDDESRVGNVKFSIFLPWSDKEHLLGELNIYYLEVMDYESDDKSVSRFLVTKNQYPHLPIYDIHKPGGPLFIKRFDTLGGIKESYYFLKVCHSYTGRVMEHVVELMLEEDPWPMCQISTATHKPFKPPINILDLPDDHFGDDLAKINTRYIASSWEDSLAGLFAWSMRNHLHWLVFERLHENTKTAVRLLTIQSPLETISPRESDVMVCNRKIDLLVELNSFIAKCQNEHDIQELLNIFTNLHACDEDCSLIGIRQLDFASVMPPYLSLMERLIASRCVRLRRDVMATLLPWPLLAYHFSDQNIDSCQKMVAFISQIEGISQEFPNPIDSTHDFYNSLGIQYTEKTTCGTIISADASVSSITDDEGPEEDICLHDSTGE